MCDEDRRGLGVDDLRTLPNGEGEGGMPLLEEISGQTLALETQRNGSMAFMAEVRVSDIKKVVELHGHRDQDDTYVWLFWTTSIDLDDEVNDRIQTGILAEQHETGNHCWKTEVKKVVPGLLMVTSVLHG